MKKHESQTTVENNWEGFSLSAQQEMLINQFGKAELGSISVGYDIWGSLNYKVLEESLTELVEKVEILRTCYRNVIGEKSSTLMVITEPYAVVLNVFEIKESSHHVDTSTSIAEKFPLKAELFRKGENKHCLVLTLPRLSADQDSLSNLMTLIVNTYNKRLSRTTTSRTEVDFAEQIVQYVDYAQWQAEQFVDNDEVSKPQVNSEFDSENEHSIALPLEGGSFSKETRNHSIVLKPEVCNLIQEFSLHTGKSISSILFTCWSVALWRIAERPNIITILTKVSHRPFEELKKSIGLFDQYIPSKVALAKGKSLLEMLDYCDEAYQAKSLAIDFKRLANTSKNEPFTEKIGFSYSKAVTVAAQDNTKWSHKAICLVSENIKLELCVYENDNIQLVLRYNSGSINFGGIKAIEVALVATINALLENPAQKVNSYSLLDLEAEKKVIQETNPSKQEVNESNCWHLAFGNCVELSPNSIALRFKRQTLTYRQLDERSNQLARFLLRNNCKRQVVIAVMMERSSWTIISMLAIHKVGAIYLPVDKNIPQGRLKEMFRQTSPQLVITDESIESIKSLNTQVLRIDNQNEEIESEDTSPFVIESSPDESAYILFTSGSTGKPKGVIVSHRALFDYSVGVIERASMNSEMSFLSLTPFYTDLGHTSLFPALIIGGQVDIAPFSRMEDAQELVEYMASSSFDVMKITPSYFSALLAIVDKPEKIMPRKALIFGGENLSWGIYRMIRSLSKTVKIYNHYGPTETCVGVICQEVSSDSDANLASTVPLGYPLKNAHIYILDEDLNVLPQGAIGELYIGGSTLAQGYVELDVNAKSPFVLDSWNESQVFNKMYKSGDKARFLPNGQIEFLGRKDRQIKVRGYRVELSEIESCLRQHKEVLDAQVIERGESTSRHLIAYVILKSRTSGITEWLNEYLKNELPDFMIPSLILSIPQFPLSASEKVDLTMLPDPSRFQRNEKSNFIEPITETERVVANIFKELLLADSIGGNDDFFDVGGHSLLATKLAAQIRKTFDIPFNLRNIFVESTVTGLAKSIDRCKER